jgi:RNA recognition motif-containing protein
LTFSLFRRKFFYLWSQQVKPFDTCVLNFIIFMNLYVANINFRSTEDELRSLFSQYGEISSLKIITDKMTGRSRGFGFVEMPNDEDAKRAIAELNGTDFMQKTLVVNEAKPREEGSGGGGFRRNNSAPRRDFGNKF